MSNEDPFASFESSDGTFVMPSPGHRSAHAGTPGPLPFDSAPPMAVEALIAATGVNPVLAAANPLLSSIPWLRASLTHGNPAGLRDSLAESVRAFERRARKSGVEERDVIAARYVLCTFLDETAASTPWGGSGVWGKQSLLVMFHNEAWGGEKVFQLMAKLAENPPAHRDLLELLYVVLSLGFEGRYRVIENGHAQLAQLRERLFAMLRKLRPEHERELSPRWKGVEARRSVIARLPAWAVLAVFGVIAIAIYLTLLMNLNMRSDPVFAEIQSLRPAVQVPSPPPVVAATPRLSAFLEPEIKAGLVVVTDFDDRSVITIRGDGFFKPGSATIDERVLPLLVRIGDALNSVRGSVLITGHTDNQPIRSARFPSNWHLSQDRAQAVRSLLEQSVTQNRLKAEGRADSEPVGDNGSAGGRAQNRRVEITLFVAGGGT